MNEKVGWEGGRYVASKDDKKSEMNDRKIRRGQKRKSDRAQVGDMDGE